MRLKGAVVRVVPTFLALLVLAAPLAAQARAGARQMDDPDRAVAGGALPAGWSARTDQPGKEGGVKFVVMGSGYHATLGPATLLWRAADSVKAPFRVTAVIQQTAAPRHPEGYGIFIGGRALAGAVQQYTYFLIRGDGQYLIKRRNGSETANVTSGWTASPAIRKADAQGRSTNRLEVVVSGRGTKFLVNGQEVYSAPAGAIDGSGIAGLRINHNLDLHIDEFRVRAE